VSYRWQIPAHAFKKRLHRVFGFEEVIADTMRRRDPHYVAVGKGGAQNDGGLFVLRKVPEIAQKSKTVHLGHRQIQQNQVGGMLRKGIEGILAICGDYHRVAGPWKKPPKNFSAGRIVIDNKDCTHQGAREPG
jgi:hypothetical protein